MVPTHDHPGRTLCPGGGEVPKGSIIVKEATYRCGKEFVGWKTIVKRLQEYLKMGQNRQIYAAIPLLAQSATFNMPSRL